MPDQPTAQPDEAPDGFSLDAEAAQTPDSDGLLIYERPMDLWTPADHSDGAARDQDDDIVEDGDVDVPADT